MISLLPKCSRKVGIGLAIFFLATAGRAAQSLIKDRYQIHDSGRTREFEVATDEVFHGGTIQRAERILGQVNAEAVRILARQLHRAATNEVELTLYPRGLPRNESNRRILTKQILLRLEPSVDPAALARSAGLTLRRQFASAPGYVLLETSETGGALTASEALRGQRGVLSAEPQLARLRQKKLIPNDPYFSQQWHLHNAGQSGGTAGIDINVTNVWDTYRGAGITIGIVDDGLQWTHADLSANYNSVLSYDFNDDDSNPLPDPLNHDYHGTSVAGVAAARGNNGVGVSGVAFEASLAGIRLIAKPTTDSQEQDAELWKNQSIQVKNNSWGAPDGGSPGEAILDGAGPLMKAALANGTTLGRGGKGVIYVFAGGNGLAADENVNYDGYANSIYVTAVGAVDARGNQAYYSEPGACLLVVAPSSGSFINQGNLIDQGITTTDLSGNDGNNSTGTFSELSNRDYTQAFGGTSSAAPVVSGVAALMLQANPALGWRDVQEILMRSATVVNLTDSDWVTNSAGIHHHHAYGAGLVNAAAAINLATNWNNLSPMATFSLTQTNLSLVIPDFNVAGVSRTFTVTNENFRVEHVALTTDISHTYYGNLAITLISPQGIASRLAEQHGVFDSADNGYTGWTFNSVRHWGEQAKGTWTVRIADTLERNTGLVNSLTLEFFGSQPTASLAATSTNLNAQITLSAKAVGWRYQIDMSTNLTNWSTHTNLLLNVTGQDSFVNTTSVTNRFYRARLLP